MGGRVLAASLLVALVSLSISIVGEATSEDELLQAVGKEPAAAPRGTIEYDRRVIQEETEGGIADEGTANAERDDEGAGRSEEALAMAEDFAARIEGHQVHEAAVLSVDVTLSEDLVPLGSLSITEQFCRKLMEDKLVRQETLNAWYRFFMGAQIEMSVGSAIGKLTIYCSGAVAAEIGKQDGRTVIHWKL